MKTNQRCEYTPKENKKLLGETLLLLSEQLRTGKKVFFADDSNILFLLEGFE